MSSKVTIQVPAKLILFGEWAVLNGGKAIGTALDTQLRIDFSPDKKIDGLKIESEGQNFLWTCDAQKDANAKIPDFFSFVVSLLRLIQRQNKNPSEKLCGSLKIHRTWRLEEGLGSSSALVVAFNALFSEVKDKQTFWLSCRTLIRDLQKGQGSGLDAAIQIFGDTIEFSDGVLPKFFKLKQPDDLYLVHTGQKISTLESLQKIQKNESSLTSIKNSTELFLQNGDWIGAIRTHYKALLQLGVVPQLIQECHDAWTRKEIIQGLKTTGAGGGDALLVWVNKEKKADFLQEIKERSWWLSTYKWGAQAFTIERSK